MKIYKSQEVAELLEQAQKLKIPLYNETTIEEIETLVKHELLKAWSKVLPYDP